MKKIGLVFNFVLLFSISFQINAQWFWQNPLPQGNTLSAVDFVDTNIGWAVGDFGTIIKTTDGGITWNSQSNRNIWWFEDVFFSDQNNGTAVGWYGTILRTINGGITWSQQISGTHQLLKGVCFTDANNGLL